MTGAASYGAQWLFFFGPFFIALAVIGYLLVTGGNGSFFDRICASLERTTGLPAWCAGGIGVGLLALVVAVLGFYWDVAWHIELGRDEFIFTPAHSGIFFGLLLIVAAGMTSIILATHTQADVRHEWAGMRIPSAAIAIVALGAGALSGFPLDEFWHRAYGIDVTMWGPTHLVMISGASLSPIALLLLYREGLRSAGATPTWLGRNLVYALAAALVIGLQTWTGEFDLGVPQFQALYHPVIVMAGSAIALVAARHLLGPGGALKAALGALAIRLVIVAVLGVGLDLVVPRFPIFLGSALAVELAARLTRDLKGIGSALVMGGGIATFGLATEWAWMSVFARNPWTGALGWGVLVAVGAALAGAIIGRALGLVFTGERPVITGRALLAASVALLVALVIPLPRREAPITARIETTPPVAGRTFVEVTLSPPTAAEGANWFEILSWQGGSMENHRLRHVGDGRYETASSVPVTDSWKSIMRLAKDDVLVGAPIYLPEDHEIGASEIPLKPTQTISLVRDTEFLMREAIEGPAWPALVAYSAIAVLAVTWLFALAWASLKVVRRPRSGEGRGYREAVA